MMAIFEKDIGTFLMEESHQVVIIPLEVSPKREFGLHIDTLDVCSHKGSFWRTPGMETEMVDAVAFAYLQITPPRCQIHRNMACVGEYTCIVFATKKSLMAVDSELSAGFLEITNAENHFLKVITFNINQEPIDIRMLFVPKFQAVILVF